MRIAQPLLMALLVALASAHGAFAQDQDQAGTPSAATAPGRTPQSDAGSRADLRESVCLLIEAAARSHDLPLEFFARVIWQESRFRADAVGPRTKSGDSAQGIAQFMPRTAAARGLLDPFDPVQALPKSAEFLRELKDQFGNLGLAAAAYNAGPGACARGLTAPARFQRRRAIMSPRSPAFRSTIGRKGGEREPPPRTMTNCGQLMALLQRAPNPFVDKLTERVRLTADSPWGIELSAGFSRDAVLAAYARVANRYAGVLGGRDASILSSVFRTRGTRPFYQIRIGAETRESANKLCAGIRRAGGACMVLRNSRG